MVNYFSKLYYGNFTIETGLYTNRTGLFTNGPVFLRKGRSFYERDLCFYEQAMRLFSYKKNYDEANKKKNKYVKIIYRENFSNPGFHAVCYIGTMLRFVQIETCFFGIIHCISGDDFEEKSVKKIVLHVYSGLSFSNI